MVRLVDGVIVEEDDPSWQWRSWTINLFGFRVPILPWGVLIAAFFFLRFGPSGFVLFAIVAGVSRFMFDGNRSDSRSRVSRGGGGSRRSGSNVRGMDDLPKTPPSS